MHANSGRMYICRQRAGNAQTSEVGALFMRAVTVLSACCRCPLMVTETLREEGVCATGGRIYGDNARVMHRHQKEGDETKIIR